MPEDINVPSAEDIARHYSACMDSVALINAGKPEAMSDEDWSGVVARNKEHLESMLAKDYWTTQDLAPIAAVVNMETPLVAPMTISDRQFAHGLAKAGVIQNAEALAFVRTGTIPAALASIISGIPDAQQRFDAEMLVSGAVEFRRDHPLVSVFAANLNWSDKEVMDFWRMAGAL